MNRIEVAFDSNVLLYLTSTDQAKAEQAENLVKAGGTVSVQVLNEVAAVARRKFRMEWSEIRELLWIIREVCEVEPTTIDTHERGIAIAQRFGYRIFDSLIIAAALDAGCTTLYSEDMQHGQRIETLTITDPFMTH
jgi:predicted nucleic acid-binding protein